MYTHIHTSIYTHTCKCIIHIPTHIYIQAYVCIHMYTYTLIHTHPYNCSNAIS